jgi:hypothetical protein
MGEGRCAAASTEASASSSQIGWPVIQAFTQGSSPRELLEMDKGTLGRVHIWGFSTVPGRPRAVKRIAVDCRHFAVQEGHAVEVNPIDRLYTPREFVVTRTFTGRRRGRRPTDVLAKMAGI